VATAGTSLTPEQRQDIVSHVDVRRATGTGFLGAVFDAGAVAGILPVHNESYRGFALG
jgi:hypothetical protein